jgi:hypothetical protein
MIVFFTVHTNYYWGANKKENDVVASKLINPLKNNGKFVMLGLPSNSDFFTLADSHSLFPEHVYSESVANLFQQQGHKVTHINNQMKIFVEDILDSNSPENSHGLLELYDFVNHTHIIPTKKQRAKFLQKIYDLNQDGFLDFRDTITIVTKS